MGTNRSVGFHPKKFWHRVDHPRVDRLSARRVQFIFQNRVGQRGLDSSARVFFVQSRGHVWNKIFSQRIIVAHRVDCVHAVSIGSANFAHQHSARHGVSVRDGLVGDEPLLLSVAVPIRKNLWRAIRAAHSSSNTARVARAAVSVRRAVVVPSFLANVLAPRVGRIDRARVDETALDQESRVENFHRHVDDSLPVDGTRLSAFDNPRADSPPRLFGSSPRVKLARPPCGFPLGWDESRQLVRDARHDRRRVVFVGDSVQRKKYFQLSAQTRVVVCDWNNHRVCFNANLYRLVRHSQSRRFFHQPVFAVVVVSLVTERIIRVRYFACRALCSTADVDRPLSAIPLPPRGLASRANIFHPRRVARPLPRRADRQPQNRRRRRLAQLGCLFHDSVDRVFISSLRPLHS